MAQRNYDDRGASNDENGTNDNNLDWRPPEPMSDARFREMMSNFDPATSSQQGSNVQPQAFSGRSSSQYPSPNDNTSLQQPFYHEEHNSQHGEARNLDQYNEQTETGNWTTQNAHNSLLPPNQVPETQVLGPQTLPSSTQLTIRRAGKRKLRNEEYEKEEQKVPKGKKERAKKEGPSKRTEKCKSAKERDDAAYGSDPLPNPWPEIANITNQFGELNASTMQKEQIMNLICQHPKDQSTGEGLVLWIGKAPSDAKDRYRSTLSSRCRLENCAVQNRIIAVSRIRVTLDSRWTTHGENQRPLDALGFMHLYCMERYLDFPEICRTADVRPDERDAMPKEPDGKWAGTLTRQSPMAEVVQEFVTATRDGTFELNYPDYPRARQIQYGYKNTLLYEIMKAKWSLTVPSKQDKFRACPQSKGQERYHLGDEHIIRHGGILEERESSGSKEVKTEPDDEQGILGGDTGDYSSQADDASFGYEGGNSDGDDSNGDDSYSDDSEGAPGPSKYRGRGKGKARAESSAQGRNSKRRKTSSARDHSTRGRGQKALPSDLNSASFRSDLFFQGDNNHRPGHGNHTNASPPSSRTRKRTATSQEIPNENDPKRRKPNKLKLNEPITLAGPSQPSSSHSGMGFSDLRLNSGTFSSRPTANTVRNASTGSSHAQASNPPNMRATLIAQGFPEPYQHGNPSQPYNFRQPGQSPAHYGQGGGHGSFTQTNQGFNQRQPSFQQNYNSQGGNPSPAEQGTNRVMTGGSNSSSNSQQRYPTMGSSAVYNQNSMATPMILQEENMAGGFAQPGMNTSGQSSSSYPQHGQGYTPYYTSTSPTANMPTFPNDPLNRTGGFGLNNRSIQSQEGSLHHTGVDGPRGRPAPIMDPAASVRRVPRANRNSQNRSANLHHRTGARADPIDLTGDTTSEEGLQAASDRDNQTLQAIPQTHSFEGRHNAGVQSGASIPANQQNIQLQSSAADRLETSNLPRYNTNYQTSTNNPIGFTQRPELQARAANLFENMNLPQGNVNVQTGTNTQIGPTHQGPQPQYDAGNPIGFMDPSQNNPNLQTNTNNQTGFNNLGSQPQGGAANLFENLYLPQNTPNYQTNTSNQTSFLHQEPHLQGGAGNQIGFANPLENDPNFQDSTNTQVGVSAPTAQPEQTVAQQPQGAQLNQGQVSPRTQRDMDYIANYRFEGEQSEEFMMQPGDYDPEAPSLLLDQHAQGSAQAPTGSLTNDRTASQDAESLFDFKQYENDFEQNEK